MQVQVHYQGLESSPWIDQFLKQRLQKLERYVGPSSSVHVNLKQESRKCVTSLSVHNLLRDHAFTADGENIYESFSSAIDKACRSLCERKRKMNNKIHRKGFMNERLAG